MNQKQLRKRLALLLAITLVVTLPVPQLSVATERAQQRPATVRRVSVHDPSIIKADGTYYVFGSHLADAKSSDLMSWRQMNADWNFRGGDGTRWQNDSVYGQILTNLSESFEWAGYNDGEHIGELAVWAPDVIYNPDYKWNATEKGAYMLYYSASSTWRRSCIGYAVSKNIEGPYEYVDTLIYSGFTKTGEVDGGGSRNTKWDNDYLNLKELIADNRISGISDNWFNGGGGWNANYAPNAIDPTVFYGKDGSLYMIYGSWSGGLFILELDKETGDARYPGTDSTDSISGNFTDRYFGTHIAGGNHQSGEGPYILYDEETDYYYLYETYGGLLAKEGYNMRLFRSRNVYGPYTDAAGRNAKDSGANNDRYGIKLIGNYTFSGQPAYRAAGHNSAFIDDDGQRYLIYHQRFDNRGETHEVRVRRQFLNEDDWPVAAVYEYRGEDIDHYDTADVVGEYEIINHGTSTDGNMIASRQITLYEDGSIDGDLSGTWEKSTGAGKKYDYITLHAGNTVYKGILYQQFNEETTPRSVMTFSAIGNDNTCLWGTRTGEAAAVEPYEDSLIYGYDFETAAVNGKISPVAISAKSGQATLQGSASIRQDASHGKVLHIENVEGANAVNYLKLPEDTLSTVTDKGYTVCMWANVDASTFEHSALFEANLNGQNGNYPMTRIGVNLLARIHAPLGTYSDGTVHAPSRGEWHHVAYSVNTEGIRTYLDGELIEETSKNLTAAFNTADEGSIQKAVHVTIGSGHIFGDEDVRAASFDNIAVYGMTLSAGQIKKVYSSNEIPVPTEKPTSTPSQKPTTVPTKEPTAAPTKKPTETPTQIPTEPTDNPVNTPTQKPTGPTEKPVVSPTQDPDEQIPSETVPPAVLKETVSLTEADRIITSANTDKGDPKGSVFAALRLKGKGGSKSVKLSWSKVKGADGYIIYGSACGKKMKEIKRVSSTKKSITIKKLKRGTYYKYLVVPYKDINKAIRVFKQSKTVHVCTLGGKAGNPTGISLKKTLTLKKGTSQKLKARLRIKKKVRVHIARFRYESTNAKVAVVNKNGKLKAKKTGTCVVYVYTQNGLYTRVKVKVK